MTISDQFGPFSEIREARTVRSGSAIVARIPKRREMTRSNTKDFLFVSVVPTTSPILATDFSAPIENNAVPKISGMTDISKETKTGPNFDPSDSNVIPGIAKLKINTITTTGRIEKDASFKRDKVYLNIECPPF